MADPIPLTQDQILAQLMTRGFEEGFQRTPLRDFWGKMDSITGEMRAGNNGSYAVAFYNFSELEVLESVEPYTSPIGQVEVPVSTKSKSKMGYLGKSIDSVINAGLPPDAPPSQVKKQDFLIGKTVHMKLTPGHLIASKDDATGAWTDKPVDCWTLMEVRGFGTGQAQPNAATPTQAAGAPVAPPQTAHARALELLRGKTEQQWHSAVFLDDVVKKDMTVIQAIINRSFLSGLEGAGKVVKDANGVYQVL